MKPTITKSEFEVLVRQCSVTLPAKQKDDVYNAYGLVELMVARVHMDLPCGTMLSVTFEAEPT